MDRRTCPHNVNTAVATLLRKSYKAGAARIGGHATTALILQSLPMHGGYQFAFYLSEHMSTLRKHLAAQAQAVKKKVASEEERLRRQCGDPGCARDEWVMQYAAENLKVKGNERFQEGSTKEALMLWAMALDAVQMPIDDDNGGIFGPREMEVEAMWRNRVPELLKALHHASTSVCTWTAAAAVSSCTHNHSHIDSSSSVAVTFSGQRSAVSSQRSAVADADADAVALAVAVAIASTALALYICSQAQPVIVFESKPLSLLA